MEKNEIVQVLTELENTCPNDYELGKLVREFVRNNFSDTISTYRDKNGKLVITQNGKIHGYQG